MSKSDLNLDLNNFEINGRKIGLDQPTYIIAELSCNHNQDYQTALNLLHAAHEAGADAIKLQTYLPETITLDSDRPEFQIKGTIWEGQNLYQLYQTTYTPWEWVPKLIVRANQLGMDLFSSPFDSTAIEFLEACGVPAYKVASFEIVDHPLLKRIAQTGKPVIISTGMASLSEISEAVEVLRSNGTTQLAILKCTSAYPAEPEDANLRNIPHLAETFHSISGLSDHTLGIEVPITAVALGARIIEKHFTLNRDSGSADDAFSLTPDEFKQMVQSVRVAERTLGKITYGGVQSEMATKRLRRSLFATNDIQPGEYLTEQNIRSIRPGHGLHPKHYSQILGKKARTYIEKGTPLAWNLVD